MSYTDFDIESSVIERMAYDSEREELIVVWSSEGEWRYRRVPISVAVAAAEAESVGAYVRRAIDGIYESYDPTSLLTDDQLMDIVHSADKLNDHISDVIEGMVPNDPAREHVFRLQGALDTYTSRLIDVVRDRKYERVLAG